MRPIHRFLFPALIICLIFGTVPTVFADEPVDIAFIDEDVAKAPLIECGDSIANGKLLLPVTLVDYYKIDLLSGQRLKVDVDAQAIGSQLDYVLQLFDNSGKTLTDGDDNLGDEAAPFDPSLEYTATDTDVRPYIVAVSINILNPEEPPIVPDSYQITFECTEQGPVIQLEPGDLLASTGPSDGSLISIDRDTGIIDFRGTLGNYGQVVDIEYRDDGVLFGAAVDEVGTIITVDPDSGEETKIGTLESGYINALEFGGDDPVSLYGIYQISEDVDSQLGTINQATGAFTFVGPSGAIDGYNKVDALAYDSLTGTMYGVGTGSNSDGIELMTIDLATGVATEVGATGADSQILALEFGPDGKLYGVTAPFKPEGQDTFITALVTIDTVYGTATEVVEVGGTAAAASTLAVTSTSSMVSGLAFKPGWSTTITSLDDNPFVGRLIDKFKFEGIQGESVKIIVDLLEKETKDELSPEGAEASPEVIETTSKWSKWSKKNFLVEGEFKGRVFLTLRDAMSDVHLRERERGPLSLTIEAVLPAKGLYYLILMQPVPRSLRVDYSLTMTSTADAFTTLEATRLIERRKWYGGAKNNVTADSTEQPGGASTLQSTSLTSTSESTPITPAADDGSDEVGDDTPPDEEYSDDPMEDPSPMKE